MVSVQPQVIGYAEIDPIVDEDDFCFQCICVGALRQIK